MSLEFKAIPDPSAEVISLIEDLTPENPFYTSEYLAVRERLGSRTCGLVLQRNGEIVAGCFGAITEGRMNARMEITSLPVIPDKEAFWRGLFDASRRMGISILSVNTFASMETTITERQGRLSHKKRSEYRLDLTNPDLWAIMNRRHHRHVKKAKSRGLSFQRADGQDAIPLHVELTNISLERHRARGESIDYQISRDEVEAFIGLGSGEIVRAVRDGEVFSSLLIARSRTGAYAQSSGTSDAGRDIGSSHFLFHEASCLLKSEGITLFNLGGADEQSTGLKEFKLGLGSTRVDLESAEFYTGSALRRVATRAAALLKGWPAFPIGV
ncbi:MAG: GNAT family N-acetyltransferase [Pyrinomonadaceae bacterium]